MNLVATHHISCTTLQLHITHGLHFPSTIAPITQLSPITNLPWLSHLTWTSFTHTHISSTLPCTHCEVLFSPVWHFQAVSLSVFPCVYLDCLYDSDRLLPAFWPCLPFDILSVCRLPRPLHCPCCWFCLAFVTPITVSEPCLFDLLLFLIKLHLDLTTLPLHYSKHATITRKSMTANTNGSETRGDTFFFLNGCQWRRGVNTVNKQIFGGNCLSFKE